LANQKQPNNQLTSETYTITTDTANITITKFLNLKKNKDAPEVRYKS